MPTQTDYLLEQIETALAARELAYLAPWFDGLVTYDGLPPQGQALSYPFIYGAFDRVTYPGDGDGAENGTMGGTAMIDQRVYYIKRVWLFGESSDPSRAELYREIRRGVDLYRRALMSNLTLGIDGVMAALPSVISLDFDNIDDEPSLGLTITVRVEVRATVEVSA